VRCGDLVENTQQAQPALVEVSACGARSRAVDLHARTVLAGEKTLGQPVVRETGQILAGAQIAQLAFVVSAVHEIVVRLQRDVSDQSLAAGDRQRFGQSRRRVV